MDIETLYFFCEIDNIDALQKYIDNKQIKKKYFNLLILCCCDFGRLKILKWLIKNENILVQNMKMNYDEACIKALNNGYSKIAKYILKNKKISKINQTYLFVLCCENNYLDIAKMLYSNGRINIQEILFDCPEMFENKNKRLSDWVMKITKYEKMNDKFLKLCEIGDLDDIRSYYNSHAVALEYQNYESLSILIMNKYNEIIKWIISLNNLPNDMQFALFVKLCETNNLEMAKEIQKKIKYSDYFHEDNINELFLNQIIHGKLTTIKNFHMLGLKITNENIIIQALIYFCNPDLYGDIEHVRILYELYSSYFINIEKQIEVFINVCQYCNVEIIEWFYNKWKLFDNHDDSIYMIALKISCETMNIEVAKWLANLFYEYQIEVKIHDNIIHECTYKKLPNDKQVYKKIIFGQITGLEQFKSLKITKSIKEKIDNVDNCCICYNKPYNLTKLNCNHFCCITCLCHWYLSNSENSKCCPYCRNEIEWKNCSKVKSNVNIIIENLETQNKIWNEKNKNIIEQRDNIKNFFESKIK